MQIVLFVVAAIAVLSWLDRKSWIKGQAKRADYKKVRGGAR